VISVNVKTSESDTGAMMKIIFVSDAKRNVYKVGFLGKGSFVL